MGHVVAIGRTVQPQHHAAGQRPSYSIPVYQRSLEYMVAVTENLILTTSMCVVIDNYMRKVQGKLAVDQVSYPFLEIN